MENRNEQKKIGSVIACDMTIVGDVTFRGGLKIDGKIEGRLEGDHAELGRDGMLEGEISLKQFDCFGKIRGSVFAERIKVKKTAEITGIVQADELEMESGSVFTGEMKITIGSSGQKEIPPASASSPRIQPASHEKPEKESLVITESEQEPIVEVGEENSVLDGLVAALVGGSSLVLVVSEESQIRKTLYRELQERLDGSYCQFFIDEPIGSFREMLINVATGFNVELSDYGNQESIIQDLTAHMTDAGRNLLIVDNVEKMYPATLERMVRYLVGEEGESTVLTKLVLFGDIELKKMIDAEGSKVFVRDPDCVFEL